VKTKSIIAGVALSMVIAHTVHAEDESGYESWADYHQGWSDWHTDMGAWHVEQGDYDSAQGDADASTLEQENADWYRSYGSSSDNEE
jgi:hypothetical protein